MSLGGPRRCEWPHCPLLLLLLLLALASPRAGAHLLAFLSAWVPVGILPPALASLPPLLPCNPTAGRVNKRCPSTNRQAPGMAKGPRRGVVRKLGREETGDAAFRQLGPLETSSDQQPLQRTLQQGY